LIQHRGGLPNLSDRICDAPSEDIAAIWRAFFVFLPESHGAFYRGIVIWQKCLKSLSEIAQLAIGVLSKGVLRGRSDCDCSGAYHHVHD
jgi:hypothetical protein